ncbi:unnamed protein product [Protopolystoma xenopodis]|uniref:NPHP4 C2-like domain-containing protein n=1 Tax=Protopolystoma xenopodis TaxID=117903 RepID=A0A3S5AFG8_9PLAT|nr:unnamed protein product [Protopolystoma xenopodis]
MRPGEDEIFFDYLQRSRLHIDVWNAESLMLIGSACVDLKHLCRQGRAGIQTIYMLDVVQPVNWSFHSSPHQLEEDIHEAEVSSTRPFGSLELQSQIRGRLHLRLSNIGRRPTISTGSSGEATTMLHSRKRKMYLIGTPDLSKVSR